jgi:hypothetical protein
MLKAIQKAASPTMQPIIMPAGLMNGSWSSRSTRALLCGALAFLVAGCASQQADQAAFAQKALVGMPKERLLACAGAPDKMATADATEYYTYTSQRLVSTPNLRGSFGYGYGRRWSPFFGYYGLGYDDGPDIQSQDCKATFIIKNGAVQGIVYGSDSDGPSARLSQCYRIVENCLSPAVPPAARR